MTARFLRYSLENERKIALVLYRDGSILKKNMLITALDEEKGTFSATLSGRKKEQVFSLSDVLTADYARGDHGELEDTQSCSKP